LFVIVLCTLCYQFLWIAHCFACHRLVYPMLPVSLDCPLFCLSSSCVPYVTSFSRLSIVLLVIVLYTLCYQFFWIVFVLLVIVLCTLCYQFLWIVFVLLVIVLCSLCYQFLRETGNIGYTRR
jgi:hypothetical protein